MPTEIVSLIVSPIVSLMGSVLAVLVAVANHLFTRRKVNAEANKLNAETEKIKAETEKIKAETNKLSAEIQEVRDSQLIGEVIFKEDSQAANKQLYWVDEESIAHLIEGQEIAPVLASRKGTIGISRSQFDRIEKGAPISVSKNSFCRIKGDYYLLVNDKVFWIASMALVQKYWDDVKAVPEIRPEEFHKYRVIR